MLIEHHFNIDSMIFQSVFGDVLRMLLGERLQRALTNLKLILSNLKDDEELLEFLMIERRMDLNMNL
jgi:hypothetical protein